MTRWTWGLGALAVLSVVLAPALLAGAPAVAQQSAPIRILLETTDEGYRCVEGCDAIDASGGPWEPVLDVPLGAVIELGFRWAHVGYIFEEHVMLIEGYRIESEQIDSENREAWVVFVADQPGSFPLKCDLHCELHDYMQRAQVRVKRAGDTAFATGPTYTPTQLELSSPSPVITGLEPVVLQASLTDGQGQPVPRAEVRFFTEVEFAGVRELVHIGTAVTDAEGVARQRFTPLSDEPEQQVLVRFTGQGLFDESEQGLSLQMTGTPRPTYAAATTGFEAMRGIARVGVVLVFGSLWATLAFVFVQALRVSRVRAAAGIKQGTAATPGTRAAVETGSVSGQGRKS